MQKAQIDHLILRLESYLECWKQFNAFMTQAREKQFGPDEENQFLELKSVLTQELELILSAIDCGPITRDEVHSLLATTPSLRILGDMNENMQRNVENHWHRLFIGLQSILGQLKVRQQQLNSQSFVKSWFKKKTT
jgi:hypothetical protein